MPGSYALSEPLLQGIRLVTFTPDDGEATVIGHAMRNDDASLILTRASQFHQAKLRNHAARLAVGEVVQDLALEIHGSTIRELDPEDAGMLAVDLTHKVAEALTHHDDAFRVTAAIAKMANVPGSMSLLRKVEALMPRVDAMSVDAEAATQEARTIERMILLRSPMIRNIVSEWREPSTLAMTA